MNYIDIIDEHLIIRETVGYEVLNQVPIEDIPKVMEFLQIVYNYNRMKRVVKEEEEVDPTIAATADFLDKEKSNFDRIQEREMKAFAKKIGWGVEEDTVEDLLERYNNPETQKRLIGLRDEEQRKFKLDDSFKKAMEETVVSDTQRYDGVSAKTFIRDESGLDGNGDPEWKSMFWENPILYARLEHMIINWSNDETKTAGELTREILKLIK